jgi:hypothetical protein
VNIVAGADIDHIDVVPCNQLLPIRFLVLPAEAPAEWRKVLSDISQAAFMTGLSGRS